MGERNEPRPKVFLTFRLLPEDRQLLQDLGRGREDVEDRHEALCSLEEIVRQLDFPTVTPPNRQPLRLGIPEKLDKTIRAVVAKTGQPYLHVLLAAAAEYRRRFPYRPKRKR